MRSPSRCVVLKPERMRVVRRHVGRIEMPSLFDSGKVRRWRRDVWRAFSSDGFKGHEIPPAMILAAVASFGTDVAVLCELAGLLTRPVDERRSAAQRARAPETRARGPRKVSARIVGPFSPKLQKSDPLYGLPEWEQAK